MSHVDILGFLPYWDHGEQRHLTLSRWSVDYGEAAKRYILCPSCLCCAVVGYIEDINIHTIFILEYVELCIVKLLRCKLYRVKTLRCTPPTPRPVLDISHADIPPPFHSHPPLQSGNDRKNDIYDRVCVCSR